ncbi:MAG TPA: hypothetical protein ENH11_04250 [Candidatus Acetothermia bacterium]|nr:hypothetical protein [Candidatus Acetothermia bacterium]
MKQATASRFLFVIIAVILFVGVRIDQGSPLTYPGASPHHRIGVYLTAYAVGKDGVLAGVMNAVRSGELNAVVINVKNMHGEITYASKVPLAIKINAATGRINMASLVQMLQASGVYVIARQVLFYDPKLSTYLGKSNPWIDPDNKVAVKYNLQIAQEVASLGVDEIQFDYARYADGGTLTPIYAARYAAVNEFLAAARRLLNGRVELSVDVFGRVLWNWNKKGIDPIGQSLEGIAPNVDFISPMLYPSHYSEQRYKDDPYGVVKEALTLGEQRVATPFRPFLQAFDRYIPAGMTMEEYIRDQVRAAKELGADGYLFWNPSCDYAVLYKALR